MSELPGYRGKILDLLNKSGLKIGDHLRIIKDDEIVEGLLMPRAELGDPNHIVIKLANGYNIGVRFSANMKVVTIKPEEKLTETAVTFSVSENKNLPAVFILSTGGTIASKVEYRTGAVYPSLSAEDLYRSIPELSGIARIKTKVLFSIFSENMTPTRWSEIALSVAESLQQEVDGVVVAHGTDTMGYTAAALSFALRNLPVPVILVGSQRSSDRPSSDAALNLLGATAAAAKAPFAEVAVAMHESISDDSIILHRATKVRKCHTSRRDAFQSVNSKPLARITKGEVSMLSNDYFRRNCTSKLEVKPNFNEKVALLKLHPGFNHDLIRWLVDRGFLGIVLEGTGLGHVNINCFSSLRMAVDNGLLVAMTSQCIWGAVRMTVYDTGRDLLNIGVLPLRDMLPETALVKMMWAFGQTDNINEAKEIMLSNVAGEYSNRLIP